MRQLGMALHNYHNTHGKFPPAYVTGPDGKPWHSWRLLILPYVEGENLYKAYSFDEPWDGPNNRKLWALMPEIFLCPGCARATTLGLIECPSNCTNYVAIVGPQTAWPGDTGKKIDDIQDGAANTLLLVEAIEPICWMEPRDLPYEQALELLTTNKKPGHLSTSDGFFAASTYSFGLNAIYSDAHVAWLPLGMEEEAASALLTSAGRELLNEDKDWYRHTDHNSYHHIVTKIHWSNIYSLTLFAILSLLPILKKTRGTDVANH